MENRTHAIIAIGFLVVLSVAAVLIFYWVSSGPGEPLAYRIVTDQSVAGLAPQSKVEFKGLEVGHVARIRFDPYDRSQVIVDFRVRQGTYITHATYAVLARQGLTGGKVLELKLGEGSDAPLQTSASDPAVIPLRKGLLAQLEVAAQQDMRELHAILVSVRKVLSADNRAHLAASIRQIDAATAKLVVIERQLMPAMKRMPELVKSAQQSLEASQELLANANTLAKQARGPVSKFGEVEDSVQRLARQLDQQTAPNIGALSRSLMRTSRQLQELVRQLQAKPQSLIFGPATRPPGPGEPGFDANAKRDDGHE